MFWSLAAIVLAILAFRRVTFGWVLLIASAIMSALVGFVTFPFGLLVGIPSALTAGLLLSGQVRRWYLRREPADWSSAPPPPPPSDQPPVW